MDNFLQKLKISSSVYCIIKKWFYKIVIHYSRHSDFINFRNLSLFANKDFHVYNNNNCDDIITLYCKVSSLNNI